MKNVVWVTYFETNTGYAIWNERIEIEPGSNIYILTGIYRKGGEHDAVIQ